MVQAKPRFQSFEEYLAVDPKDLPERRCEYVDGELIELPPESRRNLRIADYVSDSLKEIGVDKDLLYTHAFEIEVPITEQIRERSRYPDLVVILPEHLEPTEHRATLTLKMNPPQLIVEVVSPSNSRNDYEAKRQQYQLLGLPEYWIIDPIQQIITVLLLTNGQYAERKFQGSDRVVSPTFSELKLTAEQILKPGRQQW